MKWFLAHTEEVSDSGISSLLHYFEYPWFVIGFWLVVLAIIYAVVILILEKPKATVYLPIAAFHLVYGVSLYRTSPSLGALFVSIGFGLTLASVVLGLGSEEVKNKKPKKEK